MTDDRQKPARSTLPKDEGRRYWIERGEIEVLRRIRHDARTLDAAPMAIGPFARLDADAVAAGEGKTRGAITNLFGSQAAYQAEVMAMALSAAPMLEDLAYPAPEAYADADSWLDAFLDGQSARGPRHGAEPAPDYAFLWTLWLAAVPYGLWSERISGPSLGEYADWVARLEAVLGGALAHFGLRLASGVTLPDLAAAMASLIEGVWLNQCLTGDHPTRPGAGPAAHLRRSGHLLWRGATAPAS